MLVFCWYIYISVWKNRNKRNNRYNACSATVFSVTTPLQKGQNRYKISNTWSGMSVARDGPIPLKRIGDCAMTASGKRRNDCR